MEKASLTKQEILDHILEISLLLRNLNISDEKYQKLIETQGKLSLIIQGEKPLDDWILCSDMLPKIHESNADGESFKYSDIVWVTLESGKVIMAQLDGVKWYTDMEELIKEEVIAWKPFHKPAPYKRHEKEGLQIMKYGIVLKKKEYMNALIKEDVIKLFGKLDGVQALPIEFDAKETEFHAVGFITPEAASLFEYEYKKSGLNDYIALILDKATSDETVAYEYSFRGVFIYISC